MSSQHHFFWVQSSPWRPRSLQRFYRPCWSPEMWDESFCDVGDSKNKATGALVALNAGECCAQFAGECSSWPAGGWAKLNRTKGFLLSMSRATRWNGLRAPRGELAPGRTAPTPGITAPGHSQL